MTRECDIFLESFLEKGSYIKLYSYTHLLNGFAIYLTDEKVFRVLESAKNVRLIHEDTKLQKLTTHTPKLLGITTGVWPSLGGSILAGKGVVISLIDTRINPFHLSFTNEGLKGPTNFRSQSELHYMGIFSYLQVRSQSELHIRMN